MWETVVRAANKEERAPAASKQPPMVDAAHPLSAQKLFGVTFGPKSYLQLDPATKYLPVKAWYLRRRLSQAEEAYLVWPVSGQVCIVSGAGDNCAGHVEELDIETTECAWFVDPKETHVDKIFVLQIAELEPAGASTSSSTGQTMIKFNGASAKWVNSVYEVFVSWIKGKVDRYAVLQGKTGDVRWEAATKSSALTVTDTRVAVEGEARVESLGEQTRALNKERHEPPQRITVGAETRTERQGEKTSASNHAIDVPVANKLDNTMRMNPEKPVAAPRRKGRCLPIKAWFLGRKLFDEPYHLIWADGGNLTIRSGEDPNVKAKHSEVIDMAFAQRVWFVQPNEAYPDKVFVLETYETSNNKKAGDRKPFGTQFSDLFKLGSKYPDGHIVIKFDSQSPVWADPVYAQFINWLQDKVDTREKLLGKAGDAKWEAVNRMDLDTKAAEVQIRESGGSTPSASRNSARAQSPSVAASMKRRHRSRIDSTSLHANASQSSSFNTLSAQPNLVVSSKNACNGTPPKKRVKVESSTPSSEKNVRRFSNSNAFWPDRYNVDIIYVDD
ncbi:hypothetical protein DFH06DRAFT_744028 [Mycena polygramma]|nr:hypothetical protein DFH06DRAFT_744028 [Mycena polygramma]